MKVEGQIPGWAAELMTTVCKDYNRALPRYFVWRNVKNKAQQHHGFTLKHVEHKEDGSRQMQIIKVNGSSTSGTTYAFPQKIVIRAGSDENDQKLVLLHELAHHILNRSKKKRGTNGHSIRFWRLAFELYQRYGIDMKYAIAREEGYRTKATQAYQELMAK